MLTTKFTHMPKWLNTLTWTTYAHFCSFTNLDEQRKAAPFTQVSLLP